MISRSIAYSTIALLCMVVCVVVVAFWSPDSSAQVVDRKPDIEFPVPDWYSFNVIFSPDSSQIVGYGGTEKSGRIDFWHIDSRKLVHAIDVPAPVSGAGFSSDGMRLVTLASDNKFRVFRGPKWVLELQFANDTEHQTGTPEFLSDGIRFVMFGFGAGKSKVWSIEERKSAALASEMRVSQLKITNDRKLILLQDILSVELWDAETLKKIGKIRRPNGAGFTSIALSLDGSLAATGWTKGDCIPPREAKVSVWKTNPLTEQFAFDTGGDEPRTLEFSSDGKFLVCCTGSHSGTDGMTVLAKLLIWSIDTRKLIYAFRPYDTRTTILALSPNNRWLATRGNGQMFRLWDLVKIRGESRKDAE